MSLYLVIGQYARSKLCYTVNKYPVYLFQVLNQNTFKIKGRCLNVFVDICFASVYNGRLLINEISLVNNQFWNIHYRVTLLFKWHLKLCSLYIWCIWNVCCIFFMLYNNANTLVCWRLCMKSLYLLVKYANKCESSTLVYCVCCVFFEIRFVQTIGFK